MTGAWWQYAAIFAGSLFLAWVLTPLAIAFATRRGVLDQPGGHKSHESPVPYLGGLAIVTAFSVAVAVPVLIDAATSGSEELLAVLAMAIVLAVIGLVDDLRGLPPLVRLVAEIAAGAGVWALGVGVSITGVGGLDAVITVIWVVGITNAFNLLDNMDGLSAGLSAIAAGSFAAIAIANGQYLVAGLAIAVAGCATGFLRHNFHPARIYMGDAGALFFGFLIAYLGVKIKPPTVVSSSFLVPILVCSVAVLDTSLVTVTRIAHRISPFTGGRDHVSHRLVRIGLPVPVAVGVIYAAAATAGVVAFVTARVDTVSAWILAALVLGLLGVAGVLLSTVPVYPGSRKPLYRFAESAEGRAAEPSVGLDPDLEPK